MTEFDAFLNKETTPRGGGIGLSPEGIGLLATSRLTAHIVFQIINFKINYAEKSPF